MKKVFLALSLVLALVSGAFAQTSSDETNVLMADHKIIELGDKYLAFLANLYPEEVTRLGSGIYHDQLLQRDKQSQTTRAKSLKSLQKTLLSINPKKLSASKRMQYYVLLSQVNKKIFEDEDLEQLTHDPLWYLESLSSIYDIVDKNFASKEDRLRDALKRVEALPNILEQGKENLQRAPDLRLRLAAQKTQIAYTFFDTLAEKMEGMTQQQQTKEKVAKACDTAKEALKDYYDFLKVTLEKKDYTDFRLGEEKYSKLLEDVYFIDGNLAKHKKNLEVGLKSARNTLVDLLTPFIVDILDADTIAQRTDASGNLMVSPADYYFVKATKFAQAPLRGEIADTYVDDYKKAVKFFTEKEIFPQPNLALALDNNPQFLRQPYTLSNFLPPYPFATRKNNDLLINMPSKDNKGILSELFTYSDIKIDVAQKLIPGIGLSYDATDNSQQVLTNTSNDMFYLNGWMHYAVNYAQQQGYFEDEADNLNIAWLNYKRALYALVDVKLQSKELNYTQALDMIINAGIKDEEANAAVDFIAVNPADALAYIVGSKEFERLNLRYQKKMKNKFNQLEFNTKILSLGRVPLNTLAEGLESAYKTKPIESFFDTTYF